MDGSKVRTNIQGHTVIALAADAKMLRRLSSVFLGRMFREAQEQGSSQLTHEGVSYIIQRHPDHTFSLDTGTEIHRGTTL